MVSDKRSESEVFSELSKLCSSSGYFHAIAYFCFRDNTIRYSDVMTPDDVMQQFGMERLVRTEISTLIGLACKVELDFDLPAPTTLQEYIDSTESLLNEMHHSMMPDMREFFNSEKAESIEFNPFQNGSMLRESIFYGGESAYHFQYRDFSEIKYERDGDWLKDNKGYSLDQAISVITAIQHHQNKRINEILFSLAKTHPNKWSFIDAYKFNAQDISTESDVDLNTVIQVIESFVSPMGMGEFASLDDFNPKNAYPIIKIKDQEYLLFQNYSLVEALYETPFFWFYADKQYRSTAMKNRGDFTEEFSVEKLKRVFGESNVFQNVEIIDSKKNISGEIDVLVVFANRAIILQAKSKKLTIASRKGNDLSLRDDFKKAVQDAYDQAYSCSILLMDSNFKLVDEGGIELNIERDFKEIYPFCVVSDHYPSLSFQARQFLSFTETDIIKAPFVMDLFFLDVATEFLESPLYFLSYVNRRTSYGEKILSTHELTILSFHLKQNLWVDSEYSMMHLGDDICADLDLAMLVRRDGVPGEKTPGGILTKFKNTTVGKLISQIERQEDPGTIDLGFVLLCLSEDTINQLNGGIDHITELTLQDGKCHDLTIAIDMGATGLTIHSNNEPIEVSGPKLKHHAERRKYSQKAEEWFGICLEPKTKQLKFGLELRYEWEQSDDMDKIIANLPKSQRKINVGTKVKGRKIGRNEKCLCGSGIKYKKCCLNNG